MNEIVTNTIGLDQKSLCGFFFSDYCKIGMCDVEVTRWFLVGLNVDLEMP